jgi:eukaryotic-like serine/threonine-protein kinase
VRFDLTRLAVIGNSIPVVEGVGITPLGAAHYALSSTGSLAYIPGPVGSTATAQFSLGFVDRTGAVELLKVQPGAYQVPRLSPDGKRIAVGTDDGKDATIWIYDLSGASSLRRLTFDGEGHNRFPVWSADSQRVTFQSDREKDRGIFWQRADGTGTAERLLLADEGATYIPEAWSPDGTRLLYISGKDGMAALWAFSVKDKKAERFDAVVSPWDGTSGVLPGAVFAPDGKWVAYASRERRSAVYVQPFPPTGFKFQISKNEEAGHHPVWSPDGKALFYIPGPGQLHMVRIETQPAFSAGEVVRLAQQPFGIAGAPWFERPYDIGRDGQRVLGVIDATLVQTQLGTPEASQIRVVLNWGEELKRLVPAK